jgi:hypothetical protein
MFGPCDAQGNSTILNLMLPHCDFSCFAAEDPTTTGESPLMVAVRSGFSGAASKILQAMVTLPGDHGAILAMSAENGLTVLVSGLQVQPVQTAFYIHTFLDLL